MNFSETNGGPLPHRTLLEESQLEDCMTMAWLLLCTFLVVSMQLGFAMLEVGSVREAHRMTVLAKNVLDSVVSCMVWWARCTLWHTPSIVVEVSSGVMRPHLLMFHWAFCATCVTICSGSMAERTHMLAYLCHAAVVAGVIYPCIADSAWGREGMFHGQFHSRWHSGYIFHDFAGSGVVHITGGVSALMGNILLGRRILKPQASVDGGLLEQPIGTGPLAPKRLGRSADQGSASAPPQMPLREKDLQDLEEQENEQVMAVKPTAGWKRRFCDDRLDTTEFRACNYLQIMGMFTLWFGWYGFNAGLTVGTHFSHVSAASTVSWNTTLAACTGGFGSYLFCYLFHSHLDIAFLANGVLSGLVAITGPCDVASDTAAVAIGLTAGLVVYPMSSRLLRSLLLDDPVDAIAVHASCGLFGVLLVGLCQPNCIQLRATGGMMAEQIRFCEDDHSVVRQLSAQAWGAFTIIWFSLASSLALWSIFVLSELTRAMEVPYLAEADLLLCKMTTPPTASTEVSGATDGWKQVYQWSPAARKILKQHGWSAEIGFQGGAPNDLWSLRMELQRARAERETALELEDWCVFCPHWSIARVMHKLCLFRHISTLRLRIAPFSELSGLGAADSDGGQFFAAIGKVVLLLQEAQNAQRSVHSPLKREVRDLTKKIQNQDAALQRLSTRRHGFFGHHRPRLSSVPEQPEGQAGAQRSEGSQDCRRFQPFGDGESSTAGASSSATPSDVYPPSPSSSTTPLHFRSPSVSSDQWNPTRMRELQEAGIVLPVSQVGVASPRHVGIASVISGASHTSATSRTVSDRSAGLLTPRSAGEDTPPPTVIGRLQQPTRQPPAALAQGMAVGGLQNRNLHDVVSQLTVMVQAQQDLLQILHQATPPTNGGSGASDGGQSPGDGFSTPVQQQLYSALEHVARQRESWSAGVSSASTQ